MAEQKEKKKSRGGAVAGGAAALALAAYLLLGTPGLDIGLGNGGGLLPGSGNAPAQEQSVGENGAQTEAAPAEQDGLRDGTLTILIREDGIEYEGESVTAEELQTLLERDYAEGETAIEVVDDHAIKADYDGVIALLSDLSLPYEAKTAN